MKEAIKKALYAIPSIPYAKFDTLGNRIGNGVSKDIEWEGSVICRATRPPTAFCTGFVFEFLVDLLKSCHCEVSTQQIKELYWKANINEAYLTQQGFDMSAESHLWFGAAQAVIDFGWGVEVEDPTQTQLGDVLQYWNFQGGKRGGGHAIISLGGTIEEEQGTAIPTRGAEMTGVGDNFYYVEHPNASKERRWKIARLSPGFFGFSS